MDQKFHNLSPSVKAMRLRNLLDAYKYFLLLHQQNVANEASISIIKNASRMCWHEYFILLSI